MNADELIDELADVFRKTKAGKMDTKTCDSLTCNANAMVATAVAKLKAAQFRAETPNAPRIALLEDAKR